MNESETSRHAHTRHWLKQLRELSRAHTPEDLPPSSGFGLASVLLLFWVDGGRLMLLTIRRPMRLAPNLHILTFPGGVAEPHDGSPLDTALRETEKRYPSPPIASKCWGDSRTV